MCKPTGYAANGFFAAIVLKMHRGKIFTSNNQP